MAIQSYKDILDKIKEEKAIEAIPVKWIEAEIKYLRTMDFEESATLAASHIEVLLKKWREEQDAKV